MQPTNNTASGAGLETLLARRAGHVHFVGIGGVGMAGLAFHLKHAGWTVSGCDAAAGGRLTAWLKAAGIAVLAGHAPAHLAGVDWVVHSAAVGADAPELQAARTAGRPVFRRGTVLAAWLRAWTAVVVCGTHGKTTTTAMLIQILRRLGVAPAYCIGGECAALEGVAGMGATRVMVAEADESDGTLADYAPDVTVLTNLEFDHAEHYAGLDDLRACFAAVLRRTRRGVVYCADDPGAAALCQNAPGALGFGFGPAAMLRGADLRADTAPLCFAMALAGQPPVAVQLPAAGRHNALNALAACGAAHALDIPLPAAARALLDFVPVRRRFEPVVARAAAPVFSDYAHHPTEIAAAMANFQGVACGRRVVVYQPHRFSRTKALLEKFPPALAGADALLLAPVYAASEPPLMGGTIWDLYAACRRTPGVPCPMVGALPQIWEYLRRVMTRRTALLVMGAGDVEFLADQARAALRDADWPDINPIPGWRAGLTSLRLGDDTQIREWVGLAEHTTLRVGGAADLLVDAGNPADLTAILNWATAQGVPVTMLGAGSNVLVGDLGVRGLTVRLSGRPFRAAVRLDSGLVLAGAGMRLAELTAWCARHGLAGLEFLRGIPGTVGGALCMNAGAWGAAIGERVSRVQCLTMSGEMAWLAPAELQFAYRACAGLRGRVVVAAELRLTPDDRAAIRRRLDEVALKRRRMRWGACAGSVFRNPPGDHAGRLLEAAGCKALVVGGARVARTHANVIVTGTAATAADVRALQELMRNCVKASFNIELESEIVYCG